MQGLRILHLANDEKFIDQAIRAFEREAPGCNKLFVCGKVPLKHVKSEATVIRGFKAVRGAVTKALPEYNIVIVHSLNPIWFRLIRKLRASSVVIWLGWGYDYYDIINKNKSELLLPLTKKKWHVSREKKLLTEKIKSIIKRVALPSKANIIERIDIFCPVLPSEYGATKIKFDGKVFPRQGFWNYGNLEEDLIKGFEGHTVSGNNLLVGNSASAENNHLDTFSLISGIGIDGRDIISPLSYGSPQYRDFVISEGAKFFGENFKPLTNFMPIQEYIKILQSCGFVIMNHLRQQAVGNIVIMLYLGAKVFLNKSCPTFTYFKSHGAVIFSIDDLKASPSMLNERLDAKSIAINQQALEKAWSREVSRCKTRELLSLAASIKK